MANNNIGKTKRSTDELINDAIDRQQDWLNNRRKFTRNFLKKFNMFSSVENKNSTVAQQTKENKNNSVLHAYWFPLTCAFIVLFIAIFVIFGHINKPVKVVVPPVPAPVIKPIEKKQAVLIPTFDLVRVEKSGRIVIAGRAPKETNISIVVNKKVIATEHTTTDGEFVYSPKNTFVPGNYVISLIDTTNNIKSKDSVFVYVSEHGYENSVSLLMTENGSKILQSPKLKDGDLIVSKIDYLDTGRIVVTGTALPRLRVSLSLNDKYIGFARVSDYKNFGLGADVDKLESGKDYKLSIRLHDGEGNTIATVEHKFVMPEMTGDDNTFYTVRRGDCLWVIARNFLRRGILFSIIAERNNILNPDLIFPNQLLQIPVEK